MIAGGRTAHPAEAQEMDRTPRTGKRRSVAGATASTLARRLILPCLGVLLVLAVWQGTITFYGLPTIVLPGPRAVVWTLYGLLFDSSFWMDLEASLSEFAAGYAIGSVLGIAVGLMMAERPSIRMTLAPVVESLRFIVPFAWIPLTILWFGTSLTGKVVLVAYAVFFVMAVSTIRTVGHLDGTLTRVATMLGMGRWRLAFSVHLRAAAPGLASAAKAAAAIGWIAVVAAEYVGASRGLGVMITNAATSLDTATVIAGMVVIGMVGAAVSLLIEWISRACLQY